MTGLRAVRDDRRDVATPRLPDHNELATVGRRLDGIEHDVRVVNQARVVVLDRKVGRDAVMPSFLELTLDEVPVPPHVVCAVDQRVGRHRFGRRISRPDATHLAKERRAPPCRRATCGADDDIDMKSAIGLRGAIGNTPAIRLARLAASTGAEVWVKWEPANPTGSMKDRMALAMVEGAERRGELRPGGRVVEYTG